MTEREIFVAVLQIDDASGRQNYLDDACESDPALRQRVEGLLRALDRSGEFLQKPAVGRAAGLAVTAVAEGPGQQIGPYKLLEHVGEGGFGVVFLAEQHQPVRRRVALKVLKPGMDTRQVVARFEAERQALAIMDHPNIARVFDGGATASGRPYFVMELVRGVPITEYCDQNRLTPRQRLELFVPVCQAVQHAHLKGVIHRDIKPSNVIVTRHDTTPVPKVIDFGVAKALGQDLTDKTLFTGFAQMIGTPLYMSPEQAGQSGLDVDTRSDIYSLGVVLYELMTGTTPFSRERFKETAYDDIRRVIREEEPPRPSTRLSESKETLQSVSAQRRTEPAALTRLVRGELDWIVMKALEKDRTNRYESANSLARDIERYLHDEPVQARSPSAGYRLRKFVRRNRGAVLASALVLAALVAGVIGTAWQAVRATRAYGEAEANLRMANEAVNTFFTRVSEDDLLWEPALQPLRRKLLAAAEKHYRHVVSEPGENPELQAEFAATCLRITILTNELGYEEDWVPWFEKAVAAVEGLLKSNADVAMLHSVFAGQRWVGTAASMQVRDAGEVLRVTDRACAAWEELARRCPTVPGIRRDLAAFYHIIGAVHDHSTIGGVRNLSSQEKAGIYYSRSRDLLQTLVYAHPDVAHYRAGLIGVLSCLSAHQVRLRQVTEAEEGLRRALEMADQLVIDSHGSAGWRDLRGLMRQETGFLFEHIRRLDEAASAYRGMLADYDWLRDRYPMVPSYADGALRARMWLGEVLWATGHRTEAGELFREAVKLGEKIKWPDPTAKSFFASFLANCADARFRDPPKAIALAQAVISQAPGTGNYWMILGMARYRAGDYRDAVEALEKAVRLPTDLDTCQARFFLAMAHSQLGQKVEAGTRYREGVDQLEKHEYEVLEFRRTRAEAEEVLGIKKD